MGSTGTGNFTDYSGTSKSGKDGEGVGQPGSGSGGSGGGGGGDICSRSFNLTLEDVEHGDYFSLNGTPPPIGTELRIEVRKRIVAVSIKDNLVVGNIPTSHNYLAACINSGFKYEGLVQVSRSTPSAVVVSADFASV